MFIYVKYSRIKLNKINFNTKKIENGNGAKKSRKLKVELDFC